MFLTIIRFIAGIIFLALAVCLWHFLKIDPTLAFFIGLIGLTFIFYACDLDFYF